MLSPNRRSLTGGLLIDRLNRRERVGVAGGLVAAVALYASGAGRAPARILRAGLDVVERDFGDDLRPHEHDVLVARDFDLEEALRLPREHLVGQTLERLAEHDEAAALGVAGTEVQVAQRTCTAS